MVYTDLTIKALKLCYDAYIGKYDDSGFPYVFHPFHLAEKMSDEHGIVSTLLHYVVEDTDLTVEEVESLGFDQVTIEALRLMTRNYGTSYQQYLKQVKKNDIARKVLLCELEYKKELLELKRRLNFDDISRLDSYNAGINYLKKTDESSPGPMDTEKEPISTPKQIIENRQDSIIEPIPTADTTVRKSTKKIINYNTEPKQAEKNVTTPPRIKLTNPDPSSRLQESQSTDKKKTKKKEPDKVVYEGKTYLRYSDKWADASYIIVPETMQRKLNSIFAETTDFSSMNFEQILGEADKYKESSSYTLAIKYYEYAIVKGGESNARIVFPRITSCYRRSGQPQKAITLYDTLVRKYGASMISPVLLTSVAAAFCDIGKFEEARKCCDRAFAMTNGNPGGELRLVYQRLKKEGY